MVSGGGRRRDDLENQAYYDCAKKHEDIEEIARTTDEENVSGDSILSALQYGKDEAHDGIVEETKLSLVGRVAACLNAETAGIEPIPEELKTDSSLLNAASMWFSANMVLPAFAIGGLGPLVYNLNFGNSLLVIIFFNILGLLSVAFFSVFGAEFGLRQMVLSRYLTGNITARIFSTINTIACVGWGVVNTVAASQLLNTINPDSSHRLPLWGGCLIIIGATILVTFFGYNIIHQYEKWSWVPNFAVFLVIIAQLARSGNFHNDSWGSGPTTAGNILSFGCSVFGFAAGWTTYAADYTVYMPRYTNKYKIFFALVAGLSFPLFFTMILGAASAQAALHDASWSKAYADNAMGGLTFSILVPNSLHGFGQFCCVILAMSTVANNVPNMYTVSLSVQAIWSPLAKVPRIVWTLIANAATLAIAIPACYYFSTFINYFMDSIGYYLAIYISISLSEHLIYRKNSFKNYNIEDWDSWDRLPVGIAGTCALFVGAVGVALGMNQTYWVGEISRLIGDYGGDIGFELGASWAFITYNLLRPLELKHFKR